MEHPFRATVQAIASIEWLTTLRVRARDAIWSLSAIVSKMNNLTDLGVSQCEYPFGLFRPVHEWYLNLTTITVADLKYRTSWTDTNAPWPTIPKLSLLTVVCDAVRASTVRAMVLKQRGVTVDLTHCPCITQVCHIVGESKEEQAHNTFHLSTAMRLCPACILPFAIERTRVCAFCSMPCCCRGTDYPCGERTSYLCGDCTARYDADYIVSAAMAADEVNDARDHDAIAGGVVIEYHGD